MRKFPQTFEVIVRLQERSKQSYTQMNLKICLGPHYWCQCIKNFCREMKSISTATGDEHKSSRDNDNAHSEIHHWARFFWCRCRPAHPFTLSSVFKGRRAFCALPGRTACSLIMQLKNEYCALLLFFLPFKDCLLGLGS